MRSPSRRRPTGPQEASLQWENSFCAASGRCRQSEQHLVMSHEGLPLEEEIVVLAVVAGPFVILPREALDRVHRVPVSDQEEVGDLALHAAEQVDAAVAGR